MKTLFQYSQMFLTTAAVFVISALFLLIIIGNNGLLDLAENGRKNNEVQESNKLKADRIIDIYHQIQRLKRDAAYIENVVRHELGVIEPTEVVVKIKGSGNG